MQKDFTTLDYESQVKNILKKTKIKKQLNNDVIQWLCDNDMPEKAVNIAHCADYVGITNVGGIAKIVKANFCRERLCNVCAWRRQSKFMAQMYPVLQMLQEKYEFIFVTLTVKAVKLKDLKNTVDEIFKGYDRLLKHRRIKKAWAGKVRGLELKYNYSAKTFNPHIHVLVAVEKDYFTNADKYISHKMLVEYWKESMQSEEPLRCELKKVTDNERGAVETLKYSFKQMSDNTAMQGFFYALKNRRLVSFSGVFAETRKLLRLSDFENILTDDMPTNTPSKIVYTLYRFDATGGVYSYYQELEMSL